MEAQVYSLPASLQMIAKFFILAGEVALNVIIFIITVHI